MYNHTEDFVLENGLTSYDLPQSWPSFGGAARISFVLAGLVLGACAEPDSHPAGRYSFPDYTPYGTNGGFRNPNACWRSAWECPAGRP
jgi:hypothetical protein